MLDRPLSALENSPPMQPTNGPSHANNHPTNVGVRRSRRAFDRATDESPR